jgi:FtsZ-interacting cell division protein ZipA
MSTGLIVAIVVVALILIALFAFVLPRARRRAEVRARERELEQRRDRVATEHQQVAGQRERDAQRAEEQARMAQAEAQRHRSEAEMHERQADMHQRGLADDELIEDHERDRFAPALERRDERAPDEGFTSTDREGGRAHEPTGSEAMGAQEEPRTEYERGRVDEREAGSGGRFERSAEQEPTDTRRP